MPVHGPHASHRVYSNPAAAHKQSVSRKHGTRTSTTLPNNQASTAPMKVGYVAAGLAANGHLDAQYFPNLGEYLPSRRSRSRTPPRSRRPQSGVSAAMHLSPRSKKRNSQTRAQLMESLNAFQKATTVAKSVSTTQNETHTGKQARVDETSEPGVKVECSVDDVPVQPQPCAVGSEASVSTVGQNVSVSFALPGAPSTGNSASAASKPQVDASAADADGSFMTCATHMTYASAIPAIAEERSRVITAGASSFFKDCTEQSEAVLSFSPSKPVLADGDESEQSMSPLTSPEMAAQTARYGSNIGASDVEGDESTLSVSSSMVSQNKKGCRGLEGGAVLSRKSAHDSVSPGKVDTFQEVAPSVALLQVSLCPVLSSSLLFALFT